jgi:hypothetical protein
LAVIRSFIALACCLTLAASCSDGGGAASATTLSVDQLEARLLNAGDIGAGWIGTTVVDNTELGSLAESPCPGVTLPAAITERLRPVVGVRLTPIDGTNRAVFEGLIVGESATLADDVQALFDAAASCAGTDFTSADDEKVRYDTLLLPALGDQQMATVMTISQPPDHQLTVRGHTAIVRVGETVLSVTQYEVMTNPEAPAITSDAAFIDLLRTAVQRLSGEISPIG